MAWEKSQVGKATARSVWAIAYPQWTNSGYAWCGGFQVAAYKQAGVNLLDCCWWFYTPYVKNFAQKIGAWKTSNPNYGDMPEFDWTLDGVIDHIGAAWPDPNAASYRSVEGNTSPGTAGSQSNGGGAWVRYRTQPSLRGWVDMRVVLAWMIDTGKWDGKVTGKPAINTPTSTPETPVTTQEEEEMKGLTYTKDAGKTRIYMLFNEVSGFYSEFGSGTGKGSMGGEYINPLAQNWKTGSWPTVTEGHAAALKRSLDAVRVGK